MRHAGVSKGKISAHKGGTHTIQEAPSGKFVVTGGKDFLLKTWTPTGQPIASAPVHRGAVDALTAIKSTKGRLPQLWSGSADGSLFVWDSDGSGEVRASTAA